VPVIVFEGSGRVSNMLAAASTTQIGEEELTPNEQHDKLLDRVFATFAISIDEAEQMCTKIEECIRHKELVSRCMMHVFYLYGFR